MSVEFSDVRLPLAEFSLEIDAHLTGRVTGIYGASGAGKTTLLELIAGLRRPQRGRVRIVGDSVTDVARGIFVLPEHRGVGYVPQEGALFPHLTVQQNLLYGVAPEKPLVAGLNFAHVNEVLEIGGLLARRIHTLSGGEQRRVALARALLAIPRLLLLDEPLAGLDAPLRERLLPYLRRVRDEFRIPMVYVTHAANEVVALCDDVIVLARGHVEAHGAPAELFEPGGITYVRKAV